MFAAARPFIAAAAAMVLWCGASAPGEAGAAESPWRRDPFRYQGTPVAGEPDQPDDVAATATPEPMQEELALKGIVLGRDGRYRALIDGREYQAGDFIAGTRIQQISRFAIVLEDVDGIRKVGLFHDH